MKILGKDGLLGVRMTGYWETYNLSFKIYLLQGHCQVYAHKTWNIWIKTEMAMRYIIFIIRKLDIWGPMAEFFTLYQHVHKHTERAGMLPSNPRSLLFFLASYILWTTGYNLGNCPKSQLYETRPVTDTNMSKLPNPK